MLLGLAQALRSLTASPATSAISEAHRLARRRLAAGGVPQHAPDGTDDANAGDADFAIPSDVNPVEVALAIQAKLRGGRGKVAGLGDHPLQLLERKLGGRVVVPGRHLLRLGGGRYDLGRRFMHRIIAELRARRRRLT